MNEQIGELVRNGRTIYYAYINGRYVERYTREDLDDAIAARAALASAAKAA